MCRSQNIAKLLVQDIDLQSYHLSTDTLSVVRETSKEDYEAKLDKEAFSCDECDFKSETKAALKKHMESKYDKNYKVISSPKPYISKVIESEPENVAFMLYNSLNAADHQTYQKRPSHDASNA